MKSTDLSASKIAAVRNLLRAGYSQHQVAATFGRGTFSMKRLLTQGEVCELLRCSYSTLCRMMNAGDFLSPINGRGKRLLFCSDAVEKWIQARQQQIIAQSVQVRFGIGGQHGLGKFHFSVSLFIGVVYIRVMVLPHQ